MRVVVTGGTGLIGSALVRALCEQGDEVVVLTRAGSEHNTGSNPMFRQWDARSTEGWHELIDGDTAIVNLAGENVAAGRWTAARKRRILSSRVAAAEAVRSGVERAAVKPRVVLQGSAVGYYGDCGDRAVIESQAPGEDFLAGVCVETEKASRAVETHGVRWAALRTGVVLSRAGGALPRLTLPVRLGVGGRLGNGKQWLPWIHIDDMVSAILFLLHEQDASGPFNVCSFDPMRNRQFVRTLGRVLGRPAILPVPAVALRMALGEMATMLLGGQRAVPRRLLESGFRFAHPEAGGALRDLLGREKAKE